MLQDQPLIKGESREESKIWFTYHWSALKAAREAVSLDSALKKKIGPGKDDRRLVCAKNKRPLCFSKPLFAIVLCVFVIEYRINQEAEQHEIQKSTEVPSYIKYIDDTENSYFSYNIDKEKPCNKKTKFKCLSLYEKWRNIVKISKKKVTQEYLGSVRELYKWILIRNKIAHADEKKILRARISPERALDCYDDITKAIFELNIALGDGEREPEEKSCKEMLLRQ